MKERKIIEYFDFLIIHGSISTARAGKGFDVYFGGSSIGGPPFGTIDEARKALFDNLKRHVNRRLKLAEETTKNLREVHGALGDDYFNMGHFKKFE